MGSGSGVWGFENFSWDGWERVRGFGEKCIKKFFKETYLKVFKGRKLFFLEFGLFLWIF